MWVCVSMTESPVRGLPSVGHGSTSLKDTPLRASETPRDPMQKHCLGRKALPSRLPGGLSIRHCDVYLTPAGFTPALCHRHHPSFHRSGSGGLEKLNHCFKVTELINTSGIRPWSELQSYELNQYFKLLQNKKGKITKVLINTLLHTIYSPLFNNLSN